MIQAILSFFIFIYLVSLSESLPVSEKIKKVIVLMMENRSFNNIFAFMKSINSDVQGLTSYNIFS